MNRYPHNRTAMTLAEVVISTLLVGFILVSSLVSVGGATRSWQATSDLADGSQLARQLLLEVSPLAYQDPNQTPAFGIETGETSVPNSRAAFDDIDDYMNFTENPVRDRTGTILANYSGWLRYADVQKVDPTIISAGRYGVISDASADKGIRLITVTVSSPKGKTTVLNAYRTSAGGTQQQQGVNETVVNWIGCDIQAGNATTVSSGVSLLNHATDQ